MSRNWTRAQQRRYQIERKRQAALVADRLMGKKKETLFQTGDEWKWTMLKSRQIGMSTLNNYYITNPRHNVIITGIEGV